MEIKHRTQSFQLKSMENIDSLILQLQEIVINNNVYGLGMKLSVRTSA
jgi:hypothetical protein